MKVSFVLKSGLYQKLESGFCLETAKMIQIQDMFENGKPDIVLKMVRGFNTKRIHFIILISEIILSWELLSSSCLINFGNSFHY